MDSKVVSNAEHLQSLVLFLAQTNQSMQDSIQEILQPMGLNIEQLPYLCQLLRRYESISSKVIDQIQVYLHHKNSWLDRYNLVRQDIASLSLKIQNHYQQTSLISGQVQLVEMKLQQFLCEQGLTLEQVQSKNISPSQRRVVVEYYQDVSQEHDVDRDEWQAIKEQRLKFSQQIESLKANQAGLENIAEELLPSKKLLEDLTGALEKLKILRQPTLAVLCSLIIMCWQTLFPQVHHFERWNESLLPEECVAELYAFRRRLQSQRRSKIFIRFLMFRFLIELLWAFYIRIQIDNLWLPGSKKIDN